jgi:SAM-dependent methyltransferase
LAERVAPLGHVVVTDINTRDLKTNGQATLEVRQHDIVADPIEEAAFDLVHARLLLEHLREREQVLEKLAQALRPGGWLVTEDADYVSAIPISDLGAQEHQHTQSVRLQAFSASGVDTAWGGTYQLGCERWACAMWETRAGSGLWKVVRRERAGSGYRSPTCAHAWSAETCSPTRKSIGCSSCSMTRIGRPSRRSSWPYGHADEMRAVAGQLR